MADLAAFLERLLDTPEDVILPAGTDLTPYYQPFGFTIYRTAYGDSTDEHWKTLLDDIRADVVEQVTGPDGARQADPVAQQILSLFRLDARSDPKTLNGLDLDEMRKVFQDDIGGQPMNADQKERKYFLLVDQEVIAEHKAIANTPGHRSWIKCVEVDYVARDHIPRNTRLGGQRYFGWMKMGTGSVLQLWDTLGIRWLSEIAPPTIGGAQLEVWHSYGGF